MSLFPGLRVGLHSGLSVGLNPGRGEPAPTSLTFGSSSTDGTIYASASITPPADKVAIAFFGCRRSTTAPNVAVTGNGLTWVLVESETISNIRTLFAFRALGSSPSAGAVTFTCDQTQIGAVWWIGYFDAADTSGANGAGAVVQVVDETFASSTTGTTTLAALEHANNVNLTAVLTALATATVTPDADFAELNEGAIAESLALEVEWARNQTVCTPTWSTSTAAMISIEVKAA